MLIQLPGYQMSVCPLLVPNCGAAKKNSTFQASSCTCGKLGFAAKPGSREFKSFGEILHQDAGSPHAPALLWHRAAAAAVGGDIFTLQRWGEGSRLCL